MTQKKSNKTKAIVKEAELLALFEIAKAINSTLDLDEVLGIIMREILKIFKAEAGSLMLMNPEGYMTIKASSGLSQEIIDKVRVQPGEGIAGWVFESGEVLRLDGKVTDSRFKKLVSRSEEIPSSLAVPLKSRGNKIGVLMVRRKSSLMFTTHDADLISIIADQAAIAIENASLFETVNREKLKVETILKCMADGVVVTDTEGIIVLANRATGKLLNIKENEILNIHFDELFGNRCKFEHIHEAIENNQVRYKTEITIPDEREPVYLQVVATEMKMTGERREGMVILIQNITEMKRIDRMKTEFVSMVSHELKTPLTSIQGFAELMKARDFQKDRRDRYMDIILKDSSRLMRLINNILDVSKLESGQVTFKPEPVSLQEFIPDILASFEGQVKNHVITHEIPNDVPILSLDRDMFNNVITNLVSNAVKYSPDGGNITVTAKKNEENVIINIQDEGAGIPPDKLKKVFDKFYRVDSSLTRETWGTGLGLATVKYIVEAFGGKIWVESEQGKGSNFIFTLPLED
jgi:PAS domain S-box-containing protein